MSVREEILVRRAWFVPAVRIYGLPVVDDLGYLVAETIDGETAIYYATADLTGDSQTITFASLVDHRGNHLPESISSPRVIVRPRSKDSAYLLREETDREFAVARDPEATGPVLVDLLVMEMGA